MPTTEQQDADFDWYVDNLINLHMRFGDGYAIISDKRVIGVYDTFNDACDMAERCLDPGTFLVQKLGTDSSAYTAVIGLG